jgi:hypothetical protein
MRWRFKRDAAIQKIGSALPAATFAQALGRTASDRRCMVFLPSLLSDYLPNLAWRCKFRAARLFCSETAELLLPLAICLCSRI